MDNYDDLEDATSTLISAISTSFVANFVSEFASKYALCFSRREGWIVFYLFTDYTVLEELMNDKFSVLIGFREESKQKARLTLNMGFLVVMEIMKI